MVVWVISKPGPGVVLWQGDVESPTGGWQGKSNKGIGNCKNPTIGLSSLLLVVLVEISSVWVRIGCNPRLG